MDLSLIYDLSENETVQSCVKTQALKQNTANKKVEVSQVSLEEQLFFKINNSHSSHFPYADLLPFFQVIEIQ